MDLVYNLLLRPLPFGKYTIIHASQIRSVERHFLIDHDVALLSPSIFHQSTYLNSLSWICQTIGTKSLVTISIETQPCQILVDLSLPQTITHWSLETSPINSKAYLLILSSWGCCNAICRFVDVLLQTRHILLVDHNTSIATIHTRLLRSSLHTTTYSIQNNSIFDIITRVTHDGNSSVLTCRNAVEVEEIQSSGTDHWHLRVDL